MVTLYLCSVLTIVSLLLLGYEEARLRIGRLAARIVLLADNPGRSATFSRLVTVTLIQTLLFLAVGFFQLATREVRAAAFYLLLAKAALLRRPLGLTDVSSFLATAWLAFGHLWICREVLFTVEAAGILTATEEMLARISGLLLQDRLEIWIAAAAVIYLFGCLCLIGWLLKRVFLTILDYFPVARFVCITVCGSLLLIHVGLNVYSVRNSDAKITATMTKQLINQTEVSEILTCDVQPSPLPVCAVPNETAPIYFGQQEQSKTSPYRPHLVNVPLHYVLPFPAASLKYFFTSMDLRLKSCPRIRYIKRSDNDKESYFYHLLLKVYSYVATLMPKSFLDWFFGMKNER